MEEIMEEKAKRIGKFNIVDIIAVLLILAVLAFAGIKLAHRGGGETVEAAMTKVTYVVRAEGVPVELYENCLEHLPSPLMASGALVGGQIESVEKKPYYVLGPDGQWVEDPDHVTLYFTATTETPTGAVMTTTLTINVHDKITQAAGVGTQDANYEAPERTSPSSWRHVTLYMFIFATPIER